MAGVVDDVLLTIHPVVIGTAKPAMPADLRVDLELIDERRFANGAVHLTYRMRH